MKQVKLIIIFIIIIVLLISLIKIFNVQNIILEKIYPIKYEEQVEKYSKEYNIDKWLIYATIKVESNFNEMSKSTSGAIGLMQIMEATAKDVKKSLDIDYEIDLYKPGFNIMIGTKYLSDLLKEYKDNLYLALAAYNAGKGNVKKWIDNGIINQDGSDIENIPFKETNLYVRKIMQSYNIYKELYVTQRKI